MAIPTETYALDFLHELAGDPTRVLSPQEQRTRLQAAEALKQADEVIIRLGGKAGRLGESVVGTGLLEAMLQAMEQTGKAGTLVQISVDGQVAELFAEKLYQKKYWQNICVRTASSSPLEVLSTEVAREGKQILIMDFHGGNDGMPAMTTRKSVARGEATGRVTVLKRLFRVGVRSYAQRGARRRYADFIEDIFALDHGTISSDQAQPAILLSDTEIASYPTIARRYSLRPDALPIVCFFQSIVIAKCYECWDEVMLKLCDYFAGEFPDQQLDFLLACGPDESLPEGLRRGDLQEDFHGFSGVNGNARVIARHTPSLRELAILVSKAMLVLSNDTGPGHIAGALGVPTITAFLPGTIYSKQIWSSSLAHEGVTLEPNPFNYREIEAAVLWGNTRIINCIPSQRLADAAIRRLPEAFRVPSVKR